MKKDLIKYKWCIVLGLLFAAITAWVTVDLLDTEPPFTFDASKSVVIPSTAEEGEQITVRWKVSKVSRFCPGHNHRILFDPKTHIILTVYDTVPLAEADDFKPDGYLSRTFLLPRGGVLPPGPIGYRAIIGYQCNLLQHMWPMYVTTPDLFFTVDGTK